MKTQINTLRNGSAFQLLPEGVNALTNYGTNHKTVIEVWNKVIAENGATMDIELLGQRFTLSRNASVSGKTVVYFCTLTNEQMVSIFPLGKTKHNTPTLQIQGNEVVLSNGQNHYVHICPSLVTILD